MKKLLLALSAVAIASLCALAVASADAMGSATSMSAPTATVITPDKIKWMPAKGMPGVQVAVMAGDPMKAGSAYTWRLRLPAGYKFPLHWHPDAERVTVLSGTVMFGSGNTASMSKAGTYGPGTFVFIPAKVRHWVVAKSVTVLQASGVGPFSMVMVK